MPFDELGELLRHELAGGVVVEEEEWVGAAAEDVVDAVVDEVDADAAVAAGGDGHLDLGAHRIRARGEHPTVGRTRLQREQPAEGADAAEHLAGVRGGDGAPDQADGTVALIDVDTGVCVAKITHLRRECIGGLTRDAEWRRASRDGMAVSPCREYGLKSRNPAPIQ